MDALLRRTTLKGVQATKDFNAGFIRLHILHHAAKEPIFGLGIIGELKRHGYRLSAGTIYPMLHALESGGFLRSRASRNGRSVRRVYRTTARGRRALAAARAQLRELVAEVLEESAEGHS